ncbi:putative septum site-determining protein MinC [Deinococcus piscis]|uniref:Probable septum site-determining protein MinC n=1 Tax=Deinococcus piscis TaxID=394230 RepID=A0ABQ3K8I6_9DEIO|nr:septum site-determining protein MinC [Deinococcus piscis]GHG06894.1 putative septum site-determining protein MinC [Deinococcus piscis]
MKQRETHGGLMIVLEPGDTGTSVRRSLESQSLARVNVTLEIQGDTAPDAVSDAISVIARSGGRVNRVRAPRVSVSAPAPVSASDERAREESPATSSDDPNRTVILPHSLRSGFRREYGGSVVVLGDVNPGVEIVAGGDIIVMGALRGVAHAGAYGNTSAIVWARPIASAQIRIADALARSPEGSSLSTMRRLEAPAEAELARIQEDRIVISPAFSAMPPVGGEG